MAGRPRLPDHPEERVNERRRQYRESKARKIAEERRLHSIKTCRVDIGMTCPLQGYGLSRERKGVRVNG